MRLDLRALRFGYGSNPAFLGPVDVSLEAGRMLAVVGPNGAGKSTLLRLAAGLLCPNAGQALVDGVDVHRMPALDRARRMAFVPQRSELPGEMSVRDVVLMGRYPLRRYRVFETAEDFGAADDAMRATSTLALADRRVGGLSVGEQQRVQVAAALAQAPSLMLLDEPTSALDPYHQLSIFELLSRLRREEGLSVVVVTHDLNQAGQFADALLLLHDGKVVASGAAESVLSETTLRSVYGVHFHRVETLDPRRAWVLPATLS